MSYQIKNEEMGFLNKLVESLERLEKEHAYLEVDAYDVPRASDRHPYQEDDIVEDYIFLFFYKEKMFTVESSTNNHFILTLEQTEEIYKKEILFTMKENEQAIKKMWEDLLNELDETLNLKVSSHHFFHLWYDRQGIGRRLYNENEKECQIKELHRQITTFIKEEEIEEKLKIRYKKARNVRDLSMKGEMNYLTHVEFHQFLGEELYIVYSDGEFFVLKELEEALKKYEEESIRRLKEEISQEITHFKRVRN